MFARRFHKLTRRIPSRIPFKGCKSRNSGASGSQGADLTSLLGGAKACFLPWRLLRAPAAKISMLFGGAGAGEKTGGVPCSSVPRPLGLKRKALLQRLLKPQRRICYCQHIGENGERLFAEAERLGLEGIIAKKADSPYRRGRTPNWIKCKTSHGRHVDEERAKWNE